jgi:hypothetical protein
VLAAVKLLRLNSKVGKFTACLRRLVAKSRDRHLLLAGLSTKASELPVGCGPVVGHKPKGTKHSPPALGNRGAQDGRGDRRPGCSCQE